MDFRLLRLNIILFKGVLFFVWCWCYSEEGLMGNKILCYWLVLDFDYWNFLY